MVWSGPPLTVYVIIAFGVPVNVMVADPLGQTLVSEAIAAMGRRTTVIVIEPVNGCTHEGVPPEVMLTSEITVVSAYVPVILAVPAPLRITDVLIPFIAYTTVAFGVPVMTVVTVLPGQMETFEAIVAVGAGKTVMVTVPLCGCEQPGSPVVPAFTSEYTVVALKMPLIAAEPEASKLIVWLVPLTVYVTTALGVPVKVTVAACPAQIVWSDEIVTTGNWITVITTLPLTGWVHAVGPDNEIPSNVNVVETVYVLVTDAVPDPLSSMVWVAPPFIL
jgi:hypothetical protein